MKVVCPQCSQVLEGDVTPGEAIECPSCGASFFAGQTATENASKKRNVPMGKLLNPKRFRNAVLTCLFFVPFGPLAVVFAAASEAYERSNKMDAAIICDHIAARLFRASQWMMLFLLILIWIACS